MRTDSRELLAVGMFGSRSRLGVRIEMLLRRGRTFSPRASGSGVAVSAVVLGGLVLAGSVAPRWIAFAQSPGTPLFEVASIKPNVTGDAGRIIRPSGGRLTATNVTLKDLLRWAYQVKDFQISGGPDWIGSGHYDMVAKAAGKATQEEMRPMMRTLLQDRFQLAIHHATKELPIYELTVAKGGLKLQPLKAGGCITFDPDKPVLPPGRQPDDFCGNLSWRGTTFSAANASMPDLAGEFSGQLGRIVVDKTGIQGAFRVHLTLAPEEAAADGPTIFTALQEQLGLKLNAAKGPVDVIVIDHVEKPDAN